MAARTNVRILLRKLKWISVIPRRNRVKTKWAASQAKFPSTSLALQNFDVNYGTQLGDLWPSVRVSMLSEQKYGALINNFSDATEVMEELQSQGALDFVCSDFEQGDERQGTTEEYLHGDELSSVNATFSASETQEETVPPRLSPNIKCLVFPKGDISRFKPARPDSNRTLGYYLMDAASLLPVLALDAQEGHSVLDLCAAPGGKTLALLQTQAIGYLAVNDSSVSRMARLHRVLQNYIPREHWSEDQVRITSFDGRKWGELERDTFDRVLVDVPCTTDRHSLLEEDNNIFKKSRTKERQMLPLLQTQLLVAGLQAVQPGGEVLYSTCTLSQLQNECVVERAVQVAQEELGITAHVQDLGPFAQLFGDTFRFAPKPRLGELVLPHLTANFGPIYLCKLHRSH
ncbi:5-methylcytosine rRNA methyltransferase NSUN4 [Anguilla anguilla]|uniref:5-methylcytosine rRNA methyltransferase NSUN4 n=1 Tax=Anguilla anguilla TaxID=7936 RepID=UPI0015AC35DC|nr:5-methylcytosine rRNA methyltransferase NSUN4 [Anguilla anguilla]